MTTAEEIVTLYLAETVDQIATRLDAYPPDVQGFIVAKLMAMWITRHYRDDREGKLSFLQRTAVQLMWAPRSRLDS